MKTRKKKVQEVIDALDDKPEVKRVYPRYPNRFRLHWPELHLWWVGKNGTQSMVSICVYLPSNWIYLLNVYVRLSEKRLSLLERIRWKLEEWHL